MSTLTTAFSKTLPLALMENTEGADGPYLVEVMTRRQRWTFRALVAIWLVSLLAFWVWWLRPEHIQGAFGIIVSSVILAWHTLLPAWYFFFVDRMRRPNEKLPL